MDEKALVQEFEYFVEHQDQLVLKYGGKVIAIRGRRVVGVFTDELTAVTETAKKYALGTFIVQRCEPGPACYTAVFHGWYAAPSAQ